MVHSFILLQEPEQLLVETGPIVLTSPKLTVDRYHHSVEQCPWVPGADTGGRTRRASPQNWKK